MRAITRMGAAPAFTFGRAASHAASRNLSTCARARSAAVADIVSDLSDVLDLPELGGADALTVLDANRGRRKKASSIMLDSFVLNRGISHNLTQPSEKKRRHFPSEV
jgi:hypothetical protein